MQNQRGVAMSLLAPVVIVCGALAGCGSSEVATPTGGSSPSSVERTTIRNDTSATSTPASSTPASSTPASSTAIPDAPLSGSDDGVDPCSIFSHGDAEALIGTTLQPGVSAPGMCQYTGDPNAPVAQVEIYAGGGAKKILDIDRDVLGHPFTPVDGVGDEAVAEDFAIFVRSVNTWIAIRVVSLDEPDVFADRLVAAVSSAIEKL